MWSWLDSVDAVSTASSIARWLGVIIAILILVLGHRLSTLQSRAKAIERRTAGEQIASARAQAEEANKLAAALEAKQQPRTITGEHSSALRATMHRLFTNGLDVPIIIASKMLDPESEAFARQIAAALPVPPEAQAISPAGILPFEGIRIFSVGEQAIVAGERVQQAFEAAGIPFSHEPFKANACPIHPDVGVFIFVGHK